MLVAGGRGSYDNRAMPNTSKVLLTLGALAALLAVALGAFGAHALKARLSEEMLSVWKTAVDYQFYHALGLLALGLLALHFPGSRLLAWSGSFMAAGVIVFSGSLYALALTGARWFGLVTPFGGVALILAWALLIAALLGRGSG